jgi:hypothetical protein
MVTVAGFVEVHGVFSKTGGKRGRDAGEASVGLTTTVRADGARVSLAWLYKSHRIDRFERQLIRDGRFWFVRYDDHHYLTDLLKITSKGFQFLLEDRSAQIWQILMYYIQQGMVSSPSSLSCVSILWSKVGTDKGVQRLLLQEEGGGAGLDGVEVLKLLFSLSNMQLGRVSHLSPVNVACS